jgi:hypothetical protein
MGAKAYCENITAVMGKTWTPKEASKLKRQNLDSKIGTRAKEAKPGIQKKHPS